ncbi:histidine kinase dimerization/phospho-acceptor domain-containing protein [Geminicoccaceae bacterium 1502E]|nr:histidine kinase dimerization/phospho-acceptor domain-containing protein [Geminicoccaceae bacterium 1502E]
MNVDKQTAEAAAAHEPAVRGLSMEELEHELRTPLTSIRLLLEIMRDCPDLCEDQRRRFLEVLLVDEARLSRTVERLLGSDSLRRLTD